MLKDIIMKLLIKMIVAKLDAQVLTDIKNKLGNLAVLGTDAGLDYLEDYIEKSETKADDALLPLIATFREVFKIPDNDEEL